MKAKALGAVLVCGCGFAGAPGIGDGDGDGDGGDASTADAMALDAPVMLGEFGPLRRLTEIEAALWGDFATVEYDDPSISDSGELLFASDSGDAQTAGGADIFSAQQNPSTGVFESIARVDALSTGGFDTTPHLSSDGLVALVASGADILISVRAAENTPWPALTPLPETTPGEINGATVEGLGQLSADRERLYFTSNRGTDNDFDVYVATRDGENGYGDVQPVFGVDDGINQISPKLSADELTLYYTDETGPDTVMVATRDSVAAAFGAPQPLAAVNDPGFDDGDFAVSGDHRTAVMVSRRHSQTTMRLYITTR